MVLSSHARSLTDRLVDPIARVLVRLGCSANGLTTAGLVLNVAAVAVILGVDQRTGAVLLAIALVTDTFDGAVARLRGTTSTFGSFYDSAADRLTDGLILAAAAWLVRDSPLLFVVAMVALVGAQVTSYVRAKAESLGWSAAVGVLERAERVIILQLGFFFDVVPLALWILAVGAVVTIAQRWVAVLRQARATSGGQRPAGEVGL
jgi:CDP-diacylglycerol--glycerol-3-phosphate 3-phosphatidyltransferase